MNATKTYGIFFATGNSDTFEAESDDAAESAALDLLSDDYPDAIAAELQLVRDELAAREAANNWT